MGTGVLVNGVATFTTSTIAPGSYTVKAVYSGAGNFLPSTSATIAQAVGASARLNVKFSVHAVLDSTSRPKVRETPVANALVRVYTRSDACTYGRVLTLHPRTWGEVFDGLDGYNASGDTDGGCPVVKSGTYEAVATTDANGVASIIVPPASVFQNSDYVVVARTLDFDDERTLVAPDPMYSAQWVPWLRAGESRKTLLHQIRLFNGKMVSGKHIEEYGSYLAIVEPEYVEWTSDQEQYPFILVTEGEWDVTTSVEPPEGFVSDYPELTAVVEDAVDAVQFTITDIGSDWTTTKVKHTIKHKGKKKVRESDVPMYDKKPKKEKKK
jgi:hypothetical protein